MPKITFVGAGSSVFTYEIMTDILMTPALELGVFALVDIDPNDSNLCIKWQNWSSNNQEKTGELRPLLIAMTCLPEPII